MGRWFIVAQKPTVLHPVKEDKDTKYRRTEKGKQRDYRRYKKVLAIRILQKQYRIAQLEKELLDAAKI